MVAAIPRPAEFETPTRKLIDEIHAVPCADGVERVLLPGEREWNRHRRAECDGIDLPSDVREKLRPLVPASQAVPAWLNP